MADQVLQVDQQVGRIVIQQDEIQLFAVADQGPAGPQGQPGPPGQDGEASIPGTLDGGHF